MARQLELTPRLQLLADWVPQGARLADVGTDHAFLPVWLRLHDRVVFAIASDLRKLPLERARDTGRTYGADHIDYRLCNGLADILPDEVDTVAIAGMGGETIAAILEAAPWTRDGRHTLLLQPMTHAEDLRGYLADHGFAITREALAFDRGTIYPAMEVRTGEMTLMEAQRYGGARLLHDPLGDRYLIERIIRLMGAIAGMNRGSASVEKKQKADELRDLVTALMEMREEWRHANCSDNRTGTL